MKSIDCAAVLNIGAPLMDFIRILNSLSFLVGVTGVNVYVLYMLITPTIGLLHCTAHKRASRYCIYTEAKLA